MLYTLMHSDLLERPSLKKNEYYSLRQLDDPVYDEATSTQPDYVQLSGHGSKRSK